MKNSVGVSLPRALALLLGALGLFVPAPAAVLVSNVGQTESSTGTLGATHAQGFTTGSNANGYDLTSIDLNIKTTSAAHWQYIRAELWSDDNGEPDESIASLTAPSTAQTGNVAFSAPLGTTLQANTTYHLVVYSASGLATSVTITNTTSDSEDTGAAAGWSIANGSHWTTGSNPTSSTSWTDFNAARRLGVNGSNASSNADLGGLAASGAASASGPFSAFTLTPAFSASRTSYTATVANTITHAKLTPTVADTGRATVTVGGTEVPSGSESAAIALSVGATSITVQVTAQDSTTKDYTVTITRQPALSSNANLGGLTARRAASASGPFSALTLTPAFSASRTSYTATVANTITHAKLTPTVADTGRATVTVGGTEVPSGSESAAIALSVGSNPITVRVTAQDSTTKDYTVTVTRQALAVGPAPPTGLSLTASDAQLTARWTAPTGVSVQRYEVQIKLTSAASWPAADTDVTGTSHTFTSLNNGSTYQVRVRTVQVAESLHGDWSAPVEGTPQAPAATPTVWLSASPTRVPEGSPVTVTATLSAALAIGVTIPLTLTRNSSEADDHGTLASIAITANSNSGSGTITTVQDDDTDDETFTVALDTANLPSEVTAGTPASVQITIDDDPTVDNPTAGGPTGPEPLQLALWTDKPGYLADDTVRLFHTIDPRDDDGQYRVFAWLERAEGGERRYLAPLSADAALHPEAVDIHGPAQSSASPRLLPRADRALAFEGPAPAPGRWRFVLELRPGSADEQSGEPVEPLGTRRAWAPFTVAKRARLLNLSGLDREIRTDATLRSDTLYYLSHQLFVHDGATLTIEAGTVVLAYGSNTAIIVEPGGRLVAEGTREAPVVLTCWLAVGQREPGCWGGVRLLGQAPVTRQQGVAPGVLPTDRAGYGGSDADGLSGVLRYVRVEFAGATGDPDAPGPAIGLYGAGSATLLDHVQARHSLGGGFAFSGGSARCNRCVASGSGVAGLVWQRGWRGAASHLYVHHGEGGTDGIVGLGDEDGFDREPRSHPTLSNVTLLHARPYGPREREGIAVLLRYGSGLTARDLLATLFLDGAIRAAGRAYLLFDEGESSVASALLYLNGFRQVPDGFEDAVEFISRKPKLRDVRDFANPDPRPKADSPALPDEGEGYIGAFSKDENWLEQWTVFGPESAYDPRQRSEDEN